MVKRMMTGTKFDIEKFDGKNDFGLWQSQSEYIDEFHKLVGDLSAIDTAISDEDQAFLLLTSLPSSYDNLVETLLYGHDTLKLEDVLATLNSRELYKMTEAKGDGGEGLYVRRRSGNAVYGETCKIQVHMRDGSSFMLDNVRYVSELRRNLISLGTLEKEGFTVKMQSGKIKVIKGSLVVLSGTISDWVEDLDGLVCPRYVRVFGWLASIKQGMLEPVKVKCIFLGYHKGTGSVQVLQEVEFEVEPQEDYTFEVEPRGNVDQELFSYREDSNAAAFAVAAMEKIYTLESLTFNNTVACKVISKWKAGLKDDMNAQSDVYVLSNGCRKCSDDSNGYYWEYTPAKGNILGLETIRDQSGNTLRVSQSRIHNEKLVQTFLRGHSTLSLEDSLSGDCDVEKNVTQASVVVGLQTWITKSLKELPFYREDSNAATFAVAGMEKIYTHESLTFNNTVACEVISKCKVGLKDDINAQSDV
ncbi:hypothetical protein Tco_1475203, partial [Tanacetum coccineum]